MTNLDGSARPVNEANPPPASGLSLSHEDALKFMVERAHFESQLYWTRTNVFLLINAVVTGLVIQEQTSPSDWNLASLVLVAVVSVIGALFGLVWWRMQRISQYYNRVWMADARRLVLSSGDPRLFDRYLYSLGFRPRLPYLKTERGRLAVSLSPSVKEAKTLSQEPIVVNFEDVNRPTGKSATEYMEQVVAGIIGVWVLIFLFSIYAVIDLVTR